MIVEKTKETKWGKTTTHYSFYYDKVFEIEGEQYKLTGAGYKTIEGEKQPYTTMKTISTGVFTDYDDKALGEKLLRLQRLNLIKMIK